MEQLWIQILGIIGMILNFFSYQCKSTRHLYLLQGTSGLFFALNFYFLGAYTGALLNLLNIFRGFLFANCQSERNRSIISYSIIAAFLLAGILTYSGFPSVIATLAQIVGTATMGTKNGKVIRLGTLFCVSPLWLIHNILCFSLGGILAETFSLISVLLFITKFGWKNFIKAKTI